MLAHAPAGAARGGTLKRTIEAANGASHTRKLSTIDAQCPRSRGEDLVVDVLDAEAAASALGVLVEEAWHKDNTKRFAVCCGSKSELTEVYNLLIMLKVPVKPYSGDTNENAKFGDLMHPDYAWQEFGCIASTTSLSIGVDPKAIEFDRVFMWTHPQGCMLLAIFQAGTAGRMIIHWVTRQSVSSSSVCHPASAQS